MKHSTKKDAGLVILLMVIVSVVFYYVLLPMGAQPEKGKELPAQTEQLTSCETRNIS